VEIDYDAPTPDKAVIDCFFEEGGSGYAAVEIDYDAPTPDKAVMDCFFEEGGSGYAAVDKPATGFGVENATSYKSNKSSFSHTTTPWRKFLLLMRVETNEYCKITFFLELLMQKGCREIGTSNVF
jgi:hypothetical protein